MSRARYCLTPLGQRLVEANRGLVYAAMRSHHGRNLHPDDRLQVAWEGLIQAVAGFDATRGYRFGTYATHAIHHNLRAAEKEDRLIHVPRQMFSAPYRADRAQLSEAFERARTVGSLHLPSGRMIDGIPARPDHGDDADLTERFAAAVRSLPAELRIVVEGVCDGRRDSQIADLTGSTKRTVCKRRHRAIRWLRARLEVPA